MIKRAEFEIDIGVVHWTSDGRNLSSIDLSSRIDSYFYDISGVTLAERVKIIQTELQLDGLNEWDAKVENNNLVIYYRGRRE